VLDSSAAGFVPCCLAFPRSALAHPYKRRAPRKVAFAEPGQRRHFTTLDSFDQATPSVKSCTPPRHSRAVCSDSELGLRLPLLAAHRQWNGEGRVIDIDHPDLSGGGVPNGTPFPTARIVHGYDLVGDDFNADPASPAYKSRGQ
jgi:hypothetical protein